MATTPSQIWTAVNDASPGPGVEVEVRHINAPGYDCRGEIDAAGKWHCHNGFVYAIGRQAMLTFEPTHWRPLPPTTGKGDL